MDRLSVIFREINEVTSEISNFYQEVYPFLNEDTITLPTRDKDLVNEEYFKDYLESLREILHHHKLTHRTKGSEMTLT
ncbi:MAG TPA: hypothetical protein VK941_13855 [Gillisia sp.]|nr:hypothetical protein [Gillisia sp.]